MSPTLYWYDYETFGTDPIKDRIAQFAGVRTDENLNIIGQPLILFCKPADDMLPNPESCLITGITPQMAQSKGISEADFITKIHSEFSKPNTCIVGYNNIRFDDEFTRFTLYRNFFDPYGHEWQQGNSRWDIIDMVRLTRSFRPAGITWPDRTDGKPSFKLEDLTKANNIAHESKHDALSDVYATIALAKLIKSQQEKLYQYIYSHRNKHSVAKLLTHFLKQPVLHVSSKYPAEFGCTALVIPIMHHPNNKNGIIVYDLRYDPAAFINLSADTIKQLLFTPTEQLPPGSQRPPLKTIHINKCPVVVPLNTLDDKGAQHLKINKSESFAYLNALSDQSEFIAKIRSIFSVLPDNLSSDPEHSLYTGGFFTDRDRATMTAVRGSTPQKLQTTQFVFADPRLAPLLLRYKARNFPETLSEEERAEWEQYRTNRLSSPQGGGSLTLDAFYDQTNKLLTTRKFADKDLTAPQIQLLEQLLQYAQSIT